MEILLFLFYKLSKQQNTTFGSQVILAININELELKLDVLEGVVLIEFEQLW
jgi:hypothetical protein